MKRHHVILIMLVLLAGLLMLLPGDDANRTTSAAYQPPGAAHPLGTDAYGRDVAARLLAATRFDLFIVVAAVSLAFGGGIIIGALLGFAGGVADFIGMRVLEILQSIPDLLLGLLVLAALGPGTSNLILVIAVLNIPVYARLVRAEVLSRRRSPVVDAARLSGVSWLRRVFVYVLPASLTSAIAYLPVQASFTVVLVAGLGFLGLGVPLPQAEWGDMIRQGSEQLITGVWWTTLFPGVVLLAVTLGLYMAGNHLQARLPRA